jgi:hypothetical protein
MEIECPLCGIELSSRSDIREHVLGKHESEQGKLKNVVLDEFETYFLISSTLEQINFKRGLQKTQISFEFIFFHWEDLYF